MTLKKGEYPHYRNFCVYCQRNFVTRKGFEKHIHAKHKGTYAYWSLKEGKI